MSEGGTQNDNDLEARINAACARLIADFTRENQQEMFSLIGQRSPERKAQMARERGLPA